MNARPLIVLTTILCFSSALPGLALADTSVVSVDFASLGARACLPRTGTTGCNIDAATSLSTFHYEGPASGCGVSFVHFDHHHTDACIAFSTDADGGHLTVTDASYGLGLVDVGHSAKRCSNGVATHFVPVEGGERFRPFNSIVVVPEQDAGLAIVTSPC